MKFNEHGIYQNIMIEHDVTVLFNINKNVFKYLSIQTCFF